MEKIKIRNLDDVEAFCKVAQLQSFTRAAEELNIPVSAISKRLSRLEDTLGVILVQRSTRTMHLTDEGVKLLPQLQRLFDDIMILEENLLRGERPRGHIKVTLPVAFAKSSMAQIIYEYSSMYPQVDVSLQFSDRVENLVEGGFDIAVRFTKVEDSNLVMKRLGPTVLKLVCSPDYAEKYGLPKTIEELKSHNVCILPAHKRYKFLRSGITLGELAVNSSMHTNNGAFLLEMVRLGMGIAVRAHWDVLTEIESGRLIEVKLDEPLEAGNDAYLITTKNRYVSSRVRLLMDMLMEKLPVYFKE